QRLRPGDVVTCSIHFQPRQALDLVHATATLSGQEVVVSGSGTSETTLTQPLHRAQALLAPGRPVAAGEPVSGSARLRVPDGAPYSFDAKDNALRWAVEVRIAQTGLPDWTQTIPLTVAP